MKNFRNGDDLEACEVLLRPASLQHYSHIENNDETCRQGRLGPVDEKSVTNNASLPLFALLFHR